MLCDEEKALNEKTENWVYLHRLASNEDKARIEALMKDEEFLTLIEVEHGASNRLNHTVSSTTGFEIQQEVTKSCSKQEVTPIPEAGERDPGDMNCEETRIIKSLE